MWFTCKHLEVLVDANLYYWSMPISFMDYFKPKFLFWLQFPLIAFFVLEIFTFLSWLLVMLKNALISKLWLISKFKTSRTGQQIITIHILPSISRSTGNQAIKFCQLIKYGGRNIFLQKSCKNWDSGNGCRPLFVFKLSYQAVFLHKK